MPSHNPLFSITHEHQELDKSIWGVLDDFDDAIIKNPPDVGSSYQYWILVLCD